MTVDEGASPEIRAGVIFLQQRRLEDAERSFQEALGRDPEDGPALYLLALTRYLADRDREALLAVDRAVGCAPDSAETHALRAKILVALRDRSAAREAADRAIALDPTCADGWLAKALAHQLGENWKEMEAAAREALARDPDDEDAANVLATSLRLQGKEEEDAERVRDLLFRDPLNPLTHANAGWSALQAGDRAGAEEHFLEALRIDPTLEYARHGLVECYKARSPFYRMFMRFSFRMIRLPPAARWGVLIGLVVAVQALGSVVSFLVPLYLLFALWTHLASGAGNFLILLDRKARHALNRAEKATGLWVGGGLAAGIPLLVAGVVAGYRPLGLFAVGVLASTVPAAHAFTNRNPGGARLFRAFAAIALVTGAASALLAMTPSGRGQGVLVIGVLLAFLTTWLANTRLAR